MQVCRLRLSNFQSFGPDRPRSSSRTSRSSSVPTGQARPRCWKRCRDSSARSRRSARCGSRTSMCRSTGAPRGSCRQPTCGSRSTSSSPRPDSDDVHPSVPPNFSHMAIETEDGVPRVRVRLTAVLAADGEIDEKIEYILAVDDDGEPTSAPTCRDTTAATSRFTICRRDVTRPTTSRTRRRR